MPTHHASCQCGALVADFVGDPDFVIACNCRACQKRTGAPLGTGAYFLKSSMTVQGDRNSWGRKAETGRKIENFFCPTCATTLFWTLEMRPEHIGVAYGTFDSVLPDPVRAIWTEERHGWVHFPDDLPTYPKGTPET